MKDSTKMGGGWYRRLACWMAYGCSPEELERLGEVAERKQQQREQAEAEARERRIRQRQYQAPVVHLELGAALAQLGDGAVVQMEIEDVIEHGAEDGRAEGQPGEAQQPQGDGRRAADGLAEGDGEGERAGGQRQQTIKQGSHRTITARLKVLRIHTGDSAGGRS